MVHHILQWLEETAATNINLYPSFFFRSFYCWSQCHIVGNIPLVSCGPRYVSSQLMHPQPAHWPGSVRNREILDTVQWLLSSSYNINVLSTLFRSKIQNIAPQGSLWRKWTPSQPDSVLLALIIIRTVNCSVYGDKARLITKFAQIEK